MVSINAALIGAMNLAVGNAVGSNITNVSLVLVSRHWCTDCLRPEGYSELRIDLASRDGGVAVMFYDGPSTSSMDLS